MNQFINNLTLNVIVIVVINLEYNDIMIKISTWIISIYIYKTHNTVVAYRIPLQGERRTACFSCSERIHGD